MAMADNRKIKEVPLIVQEKKLLNAFPNSIIKRNGFKSLTWVVKIRPSTISQFYEITIKLGNGKVKIFVTNPKKLKLHPKRNKLPHIYSVKKQQLCLFYPNGKEWNKGKLLIDTIVPWTSEWLYFYETWLVTGDWLGEGTHPNKN